MPKRIVIALGGNALGKNLPEQMAAVKITAKAIVELIEEDNEVVICHGNGPRWA
jgi:carbamate kinase